MCDIDVMKVGCVRWESSVVSAASAVASETASKEEIRHLASVLAQKQNAEIEAASARAASGVANNEIRCLEGIVEKLRTEAEESDSSHILLKASFVVCMLMPAIW